MTQGRLQFDFSFSSPKRPAPRPDDDAPFRLLVLADLSGRGAAAPAVPLAQRKPVRVDIDNLDAVFTKLAPKLAIDFAGSPLTIEFRSFDDFHPDSLFARLAPFVSLRNLRSQLADSREFPRVAAQLGALSAAPAPAAAPTEAADAGGNDIERLLGRKPQSTPSAAPAQTQVESWVKGIVAPFVHQNVEHEQKQWLAAMDLTIAEQMRQLLHHPQFQALEAAWRSVERLVRELGADEDLQLFLADVSRDEAIADLESTAGDLARSALNLHLSGPATEASQGHRWSLLVADYTFGPTEEDLRLLNALGGLAARAGAPLLAAAHFDLVTEEKAQAAWQAVRRGAAAGSVGLVAPRVLLRLPYGASTDRIESFAFEEMHPARVHTHYLWGNAAFALAALAGQAFREDRWEMTLASQLDVSDLPSHIYREDGEPHQQPCAEILMSEATAEALLDAGVMPLISWRNRDAARLLRWQSIAEPVKPLSGAWN